jgi:sugar phosphate isomerase/epimerase
MNTDTRQLARRDFLKTTGMVAAGLGIAGLGGPTLMAGSLADGAPNAEKLGWRLGCQTYTFNRFTFQEALQKTASLGLKYVEAYPRQKLSKQDPRTTLNETMSAAERNKARSMLADAGIKLVCYGVCGFRNDEPACRKTFDFAKDMGIETITCEPAPDAFDLLNGLADEYAINVAIHNHPRPSRYWDYRTVLEVCEGRSKRIGACADTGHWMRSDINPIEALRALEGRIISLHFKDLNKFGRTDEHDVPWGTGKGDVKGMLAELHRQGFQGVFSIEYEHNWENSLPEIAQCVKYFDQTAAALAAVKPG